jgi:hypothetical protein
MEFTINARQIDWWFWTVTLVFIATALVGWIPGYYAVIALSGIQVIYFSFREGSLKGFQTQVRIVYFAITLAGLSQLLRFPVYALLLLGTIMVVFLDRCAIALVLKWLPWNRDMAPGASCEIKPEEQ